MSSLTAIAVISQVPEFMSCEPPRDRWSHRATDDNKATIRTFSEPPDDDTAVTIHSTKVQSPADRCGGSDGNIYDQVTITASLTGCSDTYTEVK